jgi:ribose transport system ATP-binding protein
MAAGIVYLSEDRKGKGLLLGQNLRVNLSLAALEKFTRGSFIDVGAEDKALDRAIQDFDIRTRRRDLLAGQLSGGNQQKLLLAKMMLVEPRVIIIDEPTRGVDIGTKEQIYRFIAGLAEQGLAVIVISSEMQELIGLCHRVVVMRNGRVAGEVAQADLSENSIVYLATGVHEERAAEIAAGHS